jgi:hypothetical protein
MGNSRIDRVSVVANREDRRVVLEALLGENVERPEGTIRNRVARCSITPGTNPHRVFDRSAGPPEIFAEALGADLVDQLVSVAVAGDLMAALCNLAYERRLSLGNPSQHEERRLVLGFLERLQQRLGGGHHPRRQSWPRVAIDHPLEVGDLEVLLQIDGEGIQGHGHQGIATYRGPEPLS